MTTGAYETRCIGTARLCDDAGMVTKPHPDYPESYHCTGMSFVGTGVYVRCDNPRHTVWTVRLPVMNFTPFNVAAGGAGTTVQYLVPDAAAAQPYAPAPAGYCPHCGRSA